MRVKAIAIGSLVAVAVLQAAPAPSGASRPVPRGCGDAWTVAPQPTPPAGTGTFNDVSASSSTDVWAVGLTEPGDTGTTARSIHGAETFTRRFDGTSWTDVASPNAPGSVSSSFWGVVAIAPDDAWAVGVSLRPKNVMRTLIEHWDGTAWTIVPSPNAGRPPHGYLYDVAAVAPDDVWAVGVYGPFREGGKGRTLILHWDGTAWTIVPSPDAGRYRSGLFSVAAVASNDAWAVGSWYTKAFVQRTLTLHWNGTRWRRAASPNVGIGENRLVSVVAIAADDIWAVGNRGNRALTEHWDGTSWSVVKSATPGVNGYLGGVAAAGSDGVWAVGSHSDRQDPYTRRTLIERWDGSGWRVAASPNDGPSDNDLNGVTSAGVRLFAVGSSWQGYDGPLAPLVLESCQSSPRSLSAAPPGRHRGADVSGAGPRIGWCPPSRSCPSSSPPVTSRPRSTG